MVWYVVDEYGFAWSDALDNLDDAKKQLEQLRAEHHTAGGTEIQFEIEWRRA